MHRRTLGGGQKSTCLLKNQRLRRAPARALRRLAQKCHIPLHQIASLRTPNRLAQYRQQLGQGVGAQLATLPYQPAIDLIGR